ncbi:MAG TPA: acetyl/propionyl/methylcrotonyl-CoA carboxylase subunit alpha [Geminicoccus sp.]|uniref:acetyl/propionyl/methylcrotonyl-CoA carboxylase subunit alpha n=1 Tax=Geminicoccus sp. TaxID=2024832 RepID=UPI002C2DCD85|nr:acetyl/propionyl/methylcrotonyl-CoA carboxylase subunit alpha [Geminicoccus sp.]HWL68636.1 acetyl/propionyl/methylcrotonyl-CoA carboxylase subunit alpha [Geminicoccus sp.]
MFKKILIANRGEIACRVIRTCKKLGIATVAVYSEADAQALHVRMADEAVAIGPAPARDSYLVIDKIVAACRQTGAEAVHPGYGFLSENPAFAQALDEAGIVFIGPPMTAVQAMGDKIESKILARKAGVSVVPGHNEPVSDPDEALRIARRIGYPVMVKAAAGGGGKGMRIAHDDPSLVEGLERARSEARSSFGDDRVFLEKYVEQPRHIEIQVLADKHGHAIHLGERECSIQRRHQKVIEEAPSPFLDEATRQAMGAQAVALAQAVDYHSAGTVEFIVDAKRNFYFLEMNTRLQVEHPVTELVTGLDLVEWMIRIAWGEQLTIRQDEVKLSGWAIEARVYAEDPSRGFLPSTGRLRRYQRPAGEGIRVDAGVAEGLDVSMFYDPMIAKLCAFAADRATAAQKLADALDAYVIRGLSHNIAFLTSLITHPRFLEGRLTTNFIAEEYGDRFEGISLPHPAKLDLAAIAVAMRMIEAERAMAGSGKLPGWRPVHVADWRVKLDDEPFDVRLDDPVEGVPRVRIEDQVVQPGLDWQPGRLLATATVNGRRLILQVDRRPEGYLFTHRGAQVTVLVRTREAADYAARMPKKQPPDLSRLLASPMPGLIVAVAVEPGQEVKAGQELCVLEAMKMQNILRAERDAVVESVKVAPGDAVASDQVLMTFVGAAG